MSNYLLPLTAGTISIALGQKLVVGTATLFAAGDAMPGDMLQVGYSFFTVGAETTITNTGLGLLDNFTGYIDGSGAWTAGSVTHVPYKLHRVSPGHGDVANLAVMQAEMYTAMRMGFAMQSVSSLTLAASGEITAVVPSGMPILEGCRLKFTSRSNVSTRWMTGQVKEYSGTTIKLDLDLKGSGSGTYTDWNINITGERGATGGTNLLTTKGDIFTHDGSNPYRLPVGGNGRALVASSAAAAGLIWVNMREALTGNLSLYVRKDGNDANNGLTNSAGGAFLTLARARAEILRLDLSGFVVTVWIGNGTYTEAGISFTTPFLGGSATFRSMSGNPADVTFAGTFNCFNMASACTLIVQDMTLAPSAGMSLIADGAGARINFANVIFAGVGAGQYHMRILYGGIINTFGNYTIAGGAARHISLETSAIFGSSGATVTLTGTPAFSGEFILCNAVCAAVLFSVTFTGAATGKRYTLIGNSVLNSFGAGSASTYFPGNSNGTTASGAQQL